MNLMRWPALLYLLPALVGCAPIIPSTATSKHLDLNSPPPDVVIFAMSGRCTQPCRAPRDNYDYLASRGTVDILAKTLEAQGLSVQVASYADNSLATYQPLKVATEQHGYAALKSDFNRMKAQWFGKPNAPRIVLLGHSHGSVWLHHLVQLNPYVPFALQIDLDGICASWSLDHAANLSTQPVDSPGEPRAIDACNVVRAGNVTVRGKDIVMPNVAYDLEVQSKRLPNRTSQSGGLLVNYTFDYTPNVRLDGSSKGIELFISPREDHSAVSYPNSDAMTWILQRTREISKDWNPNIPWH